MGYYNNWGQTEIIITRDFYCFTVWWREWWMRKWCIDLCWSMCDAAWCLQQTPVIFIPELPSDMTMCGLGEWKRKRRHHRSWVISFGTPSLWQRCFDLHNRQLPGCIAFKTQTALRVTNFHCFAQYIQFWCKIRVQPKQLWLNLESALESCSWRQ